MLLDHLILLCPVVSAGIIEQMGGQIGLKSRGVGQGCTFYFEIDASLSLDSFEAPTEELDMQVDLSVNSVSRQSEAIRPEIVPERKYSSEKLGRALVVDDSALTRKLLKNLISEYFEEIVQVNIIYNVFENFICFSDALLHFRR